MLGRMEFPTPGDGVFLPIPVWIRLPLMAILILWGARSNRRWVLPVAVCFSLPTVWLNTPTILVAVLPLIDWGADSPAGRWLRAPGVSSEVVMQRLRRRVRRDGRLLRRQLGGIAAAMSRRTAG
jgi:hypothetical protein